MNEKTRSEAVTELLIIRHSDCDEPTLADVLTVPTSAVIGADSRYSAEAAMDLIQTVCAAYAKHMADTDPDEPVCHVTMADFLSLPDEFLKGFGITNKPIDTPITLEVSMDEDLLPKSAAYCEPEFQLGQRVSVRSMNSPYFGRMGVVCDFAENALYGVVNSTATDQYRVLLDPVPANNQGYETVTIAGAELNALTEDM